MRTAALLVLTLCILSLLAACQRERVDGLPPAMPTDNLATLTPTAMDVGPTETPATSPTPTVEAIALTVTPTVSPTLSAAVTVEAVARQALRIRSGPSLQYPITGALAATGRVAVIGRSPDGGWLQIECPPGLNIGECWIIGDESFWDFEQAAALPTAAAPPLPAPTAPPPTATAVPCIVSPPSGWTAYQITAGDTLADLAGRFGVSIAQLRAINCLRADLILAGSSLFVPAATTGGTPSNASSSVAQAAALASIAFKMPGLQTPGCQVLTISPPDTDKPLVTGLASAQGIHAEAFEITDLICVYVQNLDPGQPAEVKISRPGRSDVLLSPPAAGQNAWSYLLEPGELLSGEAAATYQVQVTQGARTSPPASLVVKRATAPRLRVKTWTVAPGERAQAVAAGLGPITPLYLYRLDRTSASWQLLPDRPLRSMLANVYGEALVSVETQAQDAGYCFLLHSGEPIPEVNWYDPRVFAVGVAPGACR